MVRARSSASRSPIARRLQDRGTPAEKPWRLPKSTLRVRCRRSWCFDWKGTKRRAGGRRCQWLFSKAPKTRYFRRMAAGWRTCQEAGRNRADVYVRPFPGPGGPWQISTEGGDNPTWSRTRQELFYGAPDHRIMTASYSVAGDSFLPRKPHALPNSRFSPLVVWRSFDVHPDGNRFALVKAPEVENGPKRDHVTLIFNFFDELRRIAPTGQ